MKNFIIALILFPAAAMALMTKPTYNCQNWSYQSGYYACASYPFVEFTVDTFDLDRTLQRMDVRVAALEKGQPSSPFFNTKPEYSCMNWVQTKDGAYACGSYPFVEYVFDSNSVISIINHLDQRIAQLETEASPRPNLMQSPVYHCNQWTSNASSEYVCASYPSLEYVLDNSVVYELDRIDSRISHLEGL